jgi:hypothetical protein
VDHVNQAELEWVALHEAGHCAAALRLGRRVAYVMRETGPVERGESMGECRVPIENYEVHPSQLVIALVPYLLEWRTDWPPTYKFACAERLEALGRIIATLELHPVNYEKCVDLARTLVCDRTFLRLRREIARALVASPRLEAEDVQRLADIHLRQETTCST